MTELDITDWSDFVRGVGDPEIRERMREHLDAASEETLRTVQALRRVAAVGRSDHDDPVPEHAVRIAKAIGSVRRTPEEPATGTGKARWIEASSLRRLCLSMVFDSLPKPAPAGTRTLNGGHRHLVFEAERYRIDVRLEHELEPSSTVAVGQVSSCDGDPQPFARVPVLAFSGQDEVGRTVTSRFGEFQFEGLPRESLELCLVIGEDFLEIPLGLELSTDQEARP